VHSATVPLSWNLINDTNDTITISEGLGFSAYPPPVEFTYVIPHGNYTIAQICDNLSTGLSTYSNYDNIYDVEYFPSINAVLILLTNTVSPSSQYATFKFTGNNIGHIIGFEGNHTIQRDGSLLSNGNVQQWQVTLWTLRLDRIYTL
jgi:hypothetical protein